MQSPAPANLSRDRALNAQDVAEMLRARRSGSSWTARCPAHEDRSPSLSIREGADGRVLLHCHAGCAFPEIAQSLGVRASDLMGDAPQRADDRRVVRVVPEITADEAEIAHEILLRLWVNGAEVRVSPDHLRLVVSPLGRVPAGLIELVREHEVAVLTVLEGLDGIAIYALPGTRGHRQRGVERPLVVSPDAPTEESPGRQEARDLVRRELELARLEGPR